MDRTLGHFGDLRLEKGGPFFWGGFWNLAVAPCGFAGLEVTELARFGSRVFCATRR